MSPLNNADNDASVVLFGFPLYVLKESTKHCAIALIHAQNIPADSCSYRNLELPLNWRHKLDKLSITNA